MKVLCRGLAVIETALHLPISQIKLPLRAAIETRPVRAAFAGKRPAELDMPATKQARHQVADLSGH